MTTASWSRTLPGSMCIAGRYPSHFISHDQLGSTDGFLRSSARHGSIRFDIGSKRELRLRRIAALYWLAFAAAGFSSMSSGCGDFRGFSSSRHSIRKPQKESPLTQLA